MDANKLAVLANQTGGVDQLANILRVDAGLIQAAIDGDKLPRYQSEELDAGLLRLTLDGESSDLAIQNDIDVTLINELAESLDTAQMIMQSDQSFTKYRKIVASGGVDESDINDGWTLFGNLAPRQTEMILDRALDVNETNKENFLRALYDTRIAQRKRELIEDLIDKMPDFSPARAMQLLQRLPLDRGRRAGKPLLVGWQQRRLLAPLSAAPTLRDMFDAFNADGGDISSISESEFWEWFRNMFYA